jgi:alkylation response protein AidB-like acyl-CoA dehydrogenase
VDFQLSDDQRALADGVRSLVKGRFPLEGIRRREGESTVVDVEDWRALGEAGVFSLRVPEETGGLGLGLADAAVVFEELGRGLIPGPVVGTELAATLTPPIGGTASGDTIAGAVLLRPAPAGPVLVEHLAVLDTLLVFDASSGSVSVVDPANASARFAGLPLDPLTPMFEVTDLGSRTEVASGDAALRFERDRRVLTAALCVGIASATCELAVDYAKTRKQFGRAIGSFQAVKHLCADMLTRAEVARAAVLAAAVTADQPEVGDAERAAAGAALLATDAAMMNAKTSLQVHGGMGFTWEVPVHLYLMRAKVLSLSLGSPDALAAVVAERY